MKAKEKNHSGKINYFHRKDFENNLIKYDLNMFPIEWTDGRENLYNLEYDSNGEIKHKHNFDVSKANYNLIKTNKPDNTPNMMVKDVEGANGFWNKSDCYLNATDNMNIICVLNDSCWKDYTP
ncbi:hypothetical protein CWO85_01210 [Candidatus Phytoplasma ziziphi]|uniref:Uncharacterized protein n=2 Tax=Acholeplasmataceae TaxID=2146 RepID=A0A660HM80_ZIZJU|nr:hypothetical protein CWO85_01210 [Candidatus Phytoplasma ziziphi]